MFGLELVSAGLLHFVALDVKPSVDPIECNPTKALFIDVVSAQEDVRYDFSKKTAELNRIGKGAYSPYGEGHSNIESRGLTVGKQSLSHNVEFYFEKHKDEGLACLQIQTVKVTMNYTPTIYVSTKFREGTPIFQKILEHEKEHVNITQRVLDKYKDILEERVKNELRREFSTGPFPIANMEREQQELQDRVKRITAKVGGAMHKETQRRHNLFDDEELDESIQYNQSIVRKLEKILKIK
jgi:hypothetical protein